MKKYVNLLFRFLFFKIMFWEFLDILGCYSKSLWNILHFYKNAFPFSLELLYVVVRLEENLVTINLLVSLMFFRHDDADQKIFEYKTIYI